MSDDCTERMVQRPDGSWYCPKCGHETHLKTKPTQIRLATLEAENARLAAKLESIAGALADSGIDFKTTDAAEAVRELTRERDWYGLLARAAMSDKESGDLGLKVFWSEYNDAALVGGCWHECDFANGLPVETEPLRTALLAALTNAGQSGERE